MERLNEIRWLESLGLPFDIHILNCCRVTPGTETLWWAKIDVAPIEFNQWNKQMVATGPEMYLWVPET